MKAYVVQIANADTAAADSAYTDRDEAMARWREIAGPFVDDVEEEGEVVEYDDADQSVVWVDEVELKLEKGTQIVPLDRG